MKPRIAIPVPHSQRPEYSQRSLPQYVAALEHSGAEAVVVDPHWGQEQIAKAISACQGALLPGSVADVDPQKYGAARLEQSAPADRLRDAADELLLQDAYNLRKPLLCICYGLQSLNVWRTGTLVQDIPAQLHSPVDHSAGRAVPRAHSVQVEPGSRLAHIVAGCNHSGERPPSATEGPADPKLVFLVNSSHHQAAQVVGGGLRVSARCPQDGVIEALEGADPRHFVLAVQWHPERSYDEPESKMIFAAFLAAAVVKP